MRYGRLLVTASLALAAIACRQPPARSPLVSARTTMVTAWQVPLNPLEDKALDDSPLAKQIRWGYQIFTDTPGQAARFTGGRVSCAHCHLNAGQRERALPLVGVAGAFPEYNARASRLISLGDRIVDCFLRSENATSRVTEPAKQTEQTERAEPVERAEQAELPTPTSKEVLALSAYIAWLSRGYAVGKNPAWRGQNAIAPASLIPVNKLDRRQGEAIYAERCAACHGKDGQGVQIGDKKAGPLWGPDSWNDGAGASRVYTLAGIIRYSMPYLDPGSLTDEQAQQVATFLTSQPRPVYPFKDRDYSTTKVPADAVYYHHE